MPHAPMFFVEGAVYCIGVYQKFFSPDHGLFRGFFGTLQCRFYPSCSAYAQHSLRQYGLLVGLMVSLKRILRCHPWSEGGYDPV